MALNDSGDKSKRNTVFFIDPCDAETDRIQSAGHVDGAIQLRFGIDTRLKTDEENAVFHTGNNAEVVGVGDDLLQGCPIRFSEASLIERLTA